MPAGLSIRERSTVTNQGAEAAVAGPPDSRKPIVLRSLGFTPLRLVIVPADSTGNLVDRGQ
jgi:hypothetical protein